MVGISNQTTCGNPVYGSSRVYNRMRRKNPDLPPLVNGSGKVVAVGGKLYVVLGTVGGGSVTFSTTPSAEWRYRLETAKRLNGNGRGNGHGNVACVETETGPRDRVRAAMDVILTTLVAAERAGLVLEPELPFAAE